MPGALKHTLLQVERDKALYIEYNIKVWMSVCYCLSITFGEIAFSREDRPHKYLHPAYIIQLTLVTGVASLLNRDCLF